MTRYAAEGLAAEIGYEAPVLDDWPDANRFMVTVRYRQRAMTVPFYTGSGWSREPALDDVMECLCSDAIAIINTGCFEEWADELGFDDDSRKAEAMYRQARHQTEELRRVLGDDFERIVLSGRRSAR